jgi:uncharacterized membrane protein YfcA
VTLAPQVPWLIAVGFAAQLIDGCVGMGYGISNAVIFFVALATSLTLWLQLGTMRYDMVLALLIGGAAAAPIAPWVTSHVPQRAAATAVGVVVFVLGATGLFTTLT